MQILFYGCTGFIIFVDWCVVEACGGGSYNYSQYALPVDSRAEQMSLASPIRHVEQVRAPLLLCLGGADRRVPPSQGLQYLHTLRALYRRRKAEDPAYAAPDLRCLMFPEDNHPLDKPATEVDHWVAIVKWFAAYI